MKKYSTILADPPWQFDSPRAVVGNGGRGKHNIDKATQIDVTKQYPTMSLSELKALPIKELAEKNSHLYLWTVNAMFVEAHELARSWGFKPKTVLTWVKMRKGNECKVSMGCGYWYRSCTEHLLFCVRGKGRLLSKECYPTAYMYPRLPHSVKPDEFYDIIEANSSPAYLELFARRKRANWNSWGNEIESDVII